MPEGMSGHAGGYEWTCRRGMWTIDCGHMIIIMSIHERDYRAKQCHCAPI